MLRKGAPGRSRARGRPASSSRQPRADRKRSGPSEDHVASLEASAGDPCSAHRSPALRSTEGVRCPAIWSGATFSRRASASPRTTTVPRACLSVVQNNADAGVDGGSTASRHGRPAEDLLHLRRAFTPEAIRQSAARNGLPIRLDRPRARARPLLPTTQPEAHMRKILHPRPRRHRSPPSARPRGPRGGDSAQKNVQAMAMTPATSAGARAARGPTPGSRQRKFAYEPASGESGPATGHDRHAAHPGHAAGASAEPNITGFDVTRPPILDLRQARPSLASSSPSVGVHPATRAGSATGCAVRVVPGGVPLRRRHVRPGAEPGQLSAPEPISGARFAFTGIPISSRCTSGCDSRTRTASTRG